MPPPKSGNVPNSPASPDSHEPKRNKPIPASSTGLRPYRSPNFPHTGTITVEDKRYAVVTHAYSSRPCNWLMMTGMAVDTMVWSKADNKKTIITPIRVIFRSASVKWAVVKTKAPCGSLVHYRRAPPTQHEFLDLSRCRFRQFVHEMKCTRNFKMCQRSARKFTQLFLGRGGPGAQDDECLRRF